MPPTNVQARRKAFINFLILFIVSAGIIITTFFFSIRVPFRQNAQLRQQVNANEKEKDFSKKFTDDMLEIAATLDSINNKTNPEIINTALTTKITSLSAMVETDSVYNKNLYRNIVLSLATLQAAKKELRGKNDSGSDATRETTSKMFDMGMKLKQAQGIVNDMQRSVNSYPNLPQDFINNINKIASQLQP